MVTIVAVSAKKKRRPPRYALLCQGDSQWMVSYRSEGRLVDLVSPYWPNIGIIRLKPEDVSHVRKTLKAGKKITFK